MLGHYTMPINEIIDRVTALAHKYNVARLDLFGSFAQGNASERLHPPDTFSVVRIFESPR